MNKRWATPAFFALLAWLFYIASKGAYKGFFSSDDLDNLAWTRQSALIDFLTGLVTPQFYASNFRPIGHFYFRTLGQWAGLDFRPYVAILHLLHFANLALLWTLLARLNFTWAARAFGVVFFAFHMAVFDAYWKPMYVFDVLCAVFCLLSVILWIDRRTILSLLAFWFAYKSKELAVAIPLILAAYDYFLGNFSLRALVWHFAGSALFTVQALFSQAGRGGDYGLRLTPATLGQTIDFYASQILRLPHAGYGLLALPAWVRDRRLWWGLLAAALWLAPMLLVPGRLFGAYLYLPLAGIAVAVAALADRFGWKWLAAPMALWLVFNYAEMRDKRRAALAEADETAAFVHALQDLSTREKDLDTILIDTTPAPMYRWGVEGALRYVFHNNEMRFVFLADTQRDNSPATANVLQLTWEAPTQKLHTVRRHSGAPDLPFLEMTPSTPVWQLTRGWYQREGKYRWIMPTAAARLHRPAGANAFEVTVNIGPDYLREHGKVTLSVTAGGQRLGAREFTTTGWSTQTFPVPPGPEGPIEIEFAVDRPYRPANGDPRSLGIPIGAFGFR